MRKFVYRKVDAFTSGASRGNPAAYIMTGGEKLSYGDMLGFGRAHAGFASEVVIVEPSAAADLKMTYFSSEREVAFCGHGTVAALYDMLAREPLLRAKSEILIETGKKGVITAQNRLAREDAVYVRAPAPIVLAPTVTLAEAASALGALPGSLPLGFVDAGLRTLIVNVESLETELAVMPDIASLGSFCESCGADIVLAFSMDAPGRLAHTRVFAPRFGYLEDPATGSGNSAFGKYLLDIGLWSGEPAEIEQGPSGAEFNIVRIFADRGAVCFGGRASTRIDGVYFME